MTHRYRYLALLSITAFALSVSPDASARCGEKTLGFAGGYASRNDAGYADLYFQYSFTNHIRIAPEIGYVFRNKHMSAFEASVDMHFPARLAKGINVYPLAGLTINNWNYPMRKNETRGGFDVGGGIDFYFTPTLKLNLQGKYSIMNDTSGAFINLGVGYVF